MAQQTGAKKCVGPTNADVIADHSEYTPHSIHSDGDWSVFVTDGTYTPPEGWQIDNVNMLSSGCMVHISRE